jgi:hypothetical protein
LSTSGAPAISVISPLSAFQIIRVPFLPVRMMSLVPRQEGHAPGAVQPLGQGLDPVVVGEGRAGCENRQQGGGGHLAGYGHGLP